MNNEPQTRETCGQPLPDTKTGADVKTIREAAGVDIKTLSEHLGDIKPRTLTAIEGNKKPYIPGLYARCAASCQSIVSSRAAKLAELTQE